MESFSWVDVLAPGVPGLILTLVGVPMLFSSLWKLGWPKTTGRVVDGKEYVDDDGDRMFRLIVEFTDDKGVARKFTSEQSSSAVSHGKAVTVRYNPDAPTAVPSTNGILGFGGVVMAGVGAMLWAMAWWSVL